MRTIQENPRAHRDPRRRYLLSGLLVGPCGAEMRGSWQKSRDRGSYVCRCTNKVSHP